MEKRPLSIFYVIIGSQFFVHLSSFIQIAQYARGQTSIFSIVSYDSNALTTGLQYLWAPEDLFH